MFELFSFLFKIVMFHRATFGERLESEETHNIKVSGSRGSREMTFVVGKVRP